MSRGPKFLVTCCRWTRATKSRCRQSFTTISAINYSSRASVLGCIVNIVTDDGPVYHALSVHLSRRSTIDMLWPGVREKCRMKVLLFWRYLNFHKKQSVALVERRLHAKNTLIRSSVLMEHRLVTVRLTDRQTDTRP